MKSWTALPAPAVFLMFVLTAAPSTAQAQRDGYANPPAPAARGVSGPAVLQPNPRAQATPDTHTLSGGELLSVGSLEQSRTVFNPSFYVSETGQTGTATAGGSSGLTSLTLLGGALNVDRTWSNSHLVTTYSGGATIQPGTGFGNDSFHDFAISEEITWDRWRLRLRDDLLFSPGASFGGSGMGGPGLLGQFASANSSLSEIGSTFVLGQTIYTGRVNRLRNTALAGAEYAFSRRAVMTFTGSYGVLHFLDPGFIDSQNITGQVGFDYQLDPRNSVALIGGFGRTDYRGSPFVTDNYLTQFAYGRKITGRLAFQIAAGPTLIRLRNTGVGNVQQWVLGLNSALSYEQRRGGYSFSYTHGFSGGSGVFLGGTAHVVGANMHRRLTRFWTANLNTGYAWNTTLDGSGTTPFVIQAWYGGANLGHQLGRHMYVAFNYGAQRQSGAAACPLLSCGGSGLQQNFGVMLRWHLRGE